MSRGWIVAGQVATVALLVVVVYLTLLRPDGPGTLRGIEAPGGESTARVDSARPGSESGDRRPKDTSGGGPGPGGAGISGAGISGAGISGAGISGVGAGGVGALGAGSLDPSARADSDPSPGDDQYNDSVKTLLNKVAAGGSISE